MEFFVQKLQEVTRENPNPAIYAKAPGRINLIGEHTDYNGGLVLPAAIDKHVFVIIKENKLDLIRAQALDLSESYNFSINSLHKSGKLWVDYLIGILLEFKKLGHKIRGFDCAIISDIPIGAGMSSSAALDCALIVALNEFFKAQLSKWDIVHLSHRSNNNFLDIKSGILDQFSSIFGQKDKLIMLDCKSLEHEYIPVPESDYSWLLINTKVKHNHLISGYNDRVLECSAALDIIQKINPEVQYISDIQSEKFMEKYDFRSAVLKNRALYIVQENQRVLAFIEALKNLNYQTVGALMYEGHEGLQKLYEVSCPELDFLVDQAKKTEGILGARLMGGGFGGCTINLVKHTAIGSIKANIGESYTSQFQIKPDFYEVSFSDGASLIDV